MYTVTSFVAFGPYSKSLGSLERYIGQLEEQLTDIETNPSHKFMEKLSTVIHWIPLIVLEC